MGFSRFGFKIAYRLVCIGLFVGLAGYLAMIGTYPMAALLTGMVAAGLAWELHHFIAKTNRELSRFLDAARYADFGQRFEFSELGAGFKELGETFTFILERFRNDRSAHERELRQLKAMLEHVPVPLLSIHANEHLELWTNAARRLFASHAINHLNDLTVFGADIPAQIRRLPSGERALINLKLDAQVQTFSVASSEISLADSRRRLVSLQNIQNVVETTQLQAWQDLVRVLTHEIMNSITPVTSLAQTTVDLVDDAINRAGDTPELHEELVDIKSAVGTVAHRSEGLMNFVTSYRQLTRLPPPNKQTLVIQELFDPIRQVFLAQQQPQTLVQLHCTVSPMSLQVNADQQMLEQVLINLLQNARQSLGKRGNIFVSANLNARGRVQIQVQDDGPGIPAAIEDQIFVPFFTTRSDGSGVGLALSRQIMIAHGGHIAYAASSLGGAAFTLTF